MIWPGHRRPPDQSDIDRMLLRKVLRWWPELCRLNNRMGNDLSPKAHWAFQIRHWARAQGVISEQQWNDMAEWDNPMSIGEEIGKRMGNRFADYPVEDRERHPGSVEKVAPLPKGQKVTACMHNMLLLLNARVHAAMLAPDGLHPIRPGRGCGRGRRVRSKPASPKGSSTKGEPSQRAEPANPPSPLTATDSSCLLTRLLRGKIAKHPPPHR